MLSSCKLIINLTINLIRWSPLFFLLYILKKKKKTNGYHKGINLEFYLFLIEMRVESIVLSPGEIPILM